MGMAVICSTAVAATPVSLRVLARPQRALEAAGLLVGLVALCLFAFTGGLPLGFLLLPALVLIALRFRVLGVAAAICVIALVAVGASLIGHGPYRAAGDLSQQVMTAQLLVVVGYMPFTLLASLIEERAELVAAVEREVGAMAPAPGGPVPVGVGIPGAVVPATGPISSRAIWRNERPSRRTLAIRITMSCTAPATTTPTISQSAPGR